MLEPHLYAREDIDTVNDMDLLMVEITGDPMVTEFFISYFMFIICNSKFNHRW